MLFSTEAPPISSPTHSAPGLPFLHVLANTCLIGVRRYLTVVLTCTSLKISDVHSINCTCSF